MRKLICILGLFLLAGCGGPKTYSDPMYKGYRLDLCREWGTNCEKPAADAFCKANGFSMAGKYVIDHDIGAKTPTIIFSTGQICNQSFCDGFKSIECLK